MSGRETGRQIEGEKEKGRMSGRERWGERDIETDRRIERNRD